MGLIYLMEFSKEDYVNMSRDRSLNEEVTYWKLLNNSRTLTTISTLYACIVCMVFYEPLLTNQLSSMNVELNKVGK
jgi:ABC-type microcin C transport system permease subunit YejB